MKIYSEDSRILDAIYDDLFKQKIEVKKVAKESDSSKDRVSMGGLETAVLIIDALSNLASLHDYLEKRVPEWIIRIKGIILGEKVDMTYEEYEELSDNAKKALEENGFEVHIKNR